MSPRSVLTYICGGKCGKLDITPKYIGHQRLVEIAISTLVTDRALLLIGVLLPSAYGLLAGYQIQSLRGAAQRLAGEQASLELQEAKMLSPARMEELARQQQFIDPEPAKVVYLDSKDGSSLALNQGH